MATTSQRETKPEYRPLRRSLVWARTLMERGYLAQAVDVLGNFYERASELEWFDGPELDEILNEGRSLAGELRARMSEMAMSGHYGLGARAEPPVAKIESVLDRVRDLMKRGYASSALELLETVHQALWYWEDTGHPEVQRLLDEARQLAGRLRAETGGGEMGAITPDIERYYTRGACPYLAIALHERTGWPLALLVDDAEVASWGRRKRYPLIAHVFVVTPNGLALDIRGERPVERLRYEWYDLMEPRIVEVTLKELRALMGEQNPLESCTPEEMAKARNVVRELLG